MHTFKTKLDVTKLQGLSKSIGEQRLLEVATVNSSGPMCSAIWIRQELPEIVKIA